MIRPNRVVITGVGVLAANGIGKDAFWNSLLAGESGIGPITHFDASAIPWKTAGEVKNFDPLDFIDKSHKPRRESRSTLLSVAAAQLALSDAQMNNAILEKKSPIAIIMGSTLSGLDLVETHNRRLEASGNTKGLPSVASCLHIKTSGIIASMLSIPAYIKSLANSCSAGMDAIASATKMIRSGESEIAIAGGSDAGIIPSVVTGLGYAGLLSEHNENPSKASRPFDVFRTGGYLAEGAGVVILERLENALDRGAVPYAEIIGYDSGCDYPGMECHGYEISMRNAIANAGLMPNDIEVINAHGSSDIALDRIEIEAINNIFANAARQPVVHSIKGSTGNPLAGGGVMQLVASVQSFRERIIPPTVNLETLDPLCDADIVYGASRINYGKTALINSRGVGGVNSTMIIKAAE